MRLSKREKVLITIMLILGICFAAANFVISPIVTSYIAMKDEIGILRVEKTVADSQSNSIESLKLLRLQREEELAAQYEGTLSPMTTDEMDDIVRNMAARYKNMSVSMTLSTQDAEEMFFYKEDIDTAEPIVAASSYCTYEFEGNSSDFIKLLDEFSKLEYIEVLNFDIEMGEYREDKKEEEEAYDKLTIAISAVTAGKE